MQRFRNQGVTYHGRIDNRYVTFGKALPEPSVRDLEDALEAVLAGRSLRASRTKAIGCAIEPRR